MAGRSGTGFPHRWRTALIGLGLLAGADAAALAAERTPLQPLDYFRTRIAEDPEISPDGRYVVYSVAGRDMKRDAHYSGLWIASTDGKVNHSLTSGEPAAGARWNDVASGSARWSPSGQQVAYVGPGDSGASQIYLYNVATGRPRRVSKLPRSPSRLAWSPDGKTIAFVMAVPDPVPQLRAPAPPEGSAWRGKPFVTDSVIYRWDGGGSARPQRYHLFVMPANGGDARQISTGQVSFAGYGGVDTTKGFPCWTKDGRAIIITGRNEPDTVERASQTDVFRYEVADGHRTRLTSGDGLKTNATVSPDGRSIAYFYRSNDGEGRMYYDPILRVMDLDGGHSRAVSASLDRPVDDFAWAPDGRSLIISYADLGREKLGRLGLGGELKVLADDVGAGGLQNLGSGTHLSVSRDNRIAYSAQDETTPGDLALVERGKPRRLVRLNEQVFAERELGTSEEMWFPSSYDGLRIQAWLVKPPGFDPRRRYPVILQIHGGPNSAYGRHYDFETQLLAATGYVVLMVNYRGSLSYGDKFASALEGQFPGDGVTADLLSGVEALAREPWIDGTRVFVCGGSGGGTLTTWLVGKSNRFRAAASYYPVTHFETFALTSDMPYRVTTRWFKGPPWGKYREDYWQHSPISLVASVKTPTLIMSGEQDWRTPINQAEMYFTALKLNGVEARLVRFPNEGHGLADIPSDRIVKIEATIDWFAAHGGLPAR